jgi:sugar phosphate isomerase/epimerase
MASMQLGVITRIEQGAMEALSKVAQFGIPTCQLSCWHPEHYTKQNAAAVKDAEQATGVQISALWGGYLGKHEWNFTRGPETLGFPPEATRKERVSVLKKAGTFARDIGVPAVVTHCGFIPENPNDARYKATVKCVRQIAKHYEKLGIEFWFETGQETPVVLLRTIEDVGTGNLGINLDPANLILYGKANPVDSLDVFGKYVKGFHAKDGLYPTNGLSLGKETPLGKGKVDFTALLAALKKLRYRNPLTIEREISGPKQKRDIMKGKKFLEEILAEI